MIEFFAYTGLINAIIIFIIGGVVLIKNPHKRVNQMFALFCSSGIIWGASYFMWLKSGNEHDALFWARMLDFGSILMPIFYLHWTLLFIGEAKKYKWLLFYGYAISIFFGAFSFSDLFIKGVYPISFFPWFPDAGILHPFFLVLSFFGLLIISIYLLCKKYKTSTGIKREQIKYIIIGSIIGFGGGAFNFFMIYHVPIPPYLNFAVFVYFLIFAYAILKYRLLDIKIVFKKSVFYILTLGILLFIAILFFILLQNFLEDYLKIDPKISVAILVVILILVLPKVRDYIKDQFDKIFLKDYIDFSEKIDQLDKTSQFGTKLADLTKEISVELKKMLKVEQVEFYTLDKRQNEFVCRYPAEHEKKIIKNGLFKALNEKREIIIREELNYLQPRDKEEKKQIKELSKNLEKLNSAAAIPIFSGKEFIGIILISQKQGRENFSKEDLDLMDLMVGKMGDILANVMLYQESIENIRINQQQK